MNRNKDKDKNTENTDAAPVHNVIEQVFCIKKKAYESCHDKTSEDESDVENDRQNDDLCCSYRRYKDFSERSEYAVK
ncbi:hypothetical protein BDBG_16126 [Blastomyces gilchristii SLH14081]|uniref:Uncharacterized protein n=1 Tax=Blastomyces gilchristii (strain SLH14081) TaxID=559298 RepID=A0A179U9M1_BLAGS|nr:uncharacterized protein BDBG_16126 [Blastomyces gilchristii SLH14081]OAT03857.1 hypothetical protein BDBG_16126 [Blastomyces gilchristii SLH14081]